MIDVHDFPFDLIFSCKRLYKKLKYIFKKLIQMIMLKFTFKAKRSFLNVIFVFVVMIHGIVEGTFV